MGSTRHFPRGCVASPHHLASAAGQAVLADGGTAVDAAVAANLVLAVVTPYHCGVGGDLLAIVWDGDEVHAVQSVGAAPAGATPEAIRAAVEAGHGDSGTAFPGTGGMPRYGALAVTVPGAVAGWFELLGRWGSRSFGDLSAAARRLAIEGFPVSRHAQAHVARARLAHGDQPAWLEHYGRMGQEPRFVQTELGATLDTLATHGPRALYGGPLGGLVVEALQAGGSTMELADLLAHDVVAVEPLSARYRDVDVLELPPPTQGVTALTALRLLDEMGPIPTDAAEAAHLRIEATRAALADRQEHLADPRSMQVTPDQLLADDRIAAMARRIDRSRAADWPPARPAPGGTASVCAADADGMLVSLIQSNFVGFGSGVVVPGTGIGLHDRGAHFSLDVADPNVIEPGKLPMHTLIPAMALRDGAPWLVFGTMGGDGQAQTHVQLLGQLVDDGVELQEAIDAPRWLVDPADGGVAVEARSDLAVVDGLRSRGHAVTHLGDFDHAAGHAQAIMVAPGGYAGASDPRCEGGVHGI